MNRVGEKENVLNKIKWICRVLVRRKKHGYDLKIVQHGQGACLWGCKGRAEQEQQEMKLEKSAVRN